jgi:gamma-glutamyltranspeptidase / glutathione hydrolase
VKYLLVLALTACQILPIPSAKESLQPEVSEVFTPAVLATAPKAMAATPHPLATKAALEVLKKGGTAVDAAIAAQVMLTLVEPFASGLGGGGFMLTYNAKTTAIRAYDGRETAPASATPDMFMGQDFNTAAVGGASVGVPGLLAMLAKAHQQHGHLPFAALLKPTIHLADQGFIISRRLARLISEDAYLKRTAPYFYNASGQPLPAGARLKNPALAKTLRIIAKQGTQAFYKGSIAEDISHAVRTSPVRSTVFTVDDLKKYQAIERTPLCRPYRAYLVCGMPAPSSGGTVTLQVLAFLEKFNLGQSLNANALHLLFEASRLAYADRDAYLADPAFVPYDQPQLISDEYLAKRAALINPARSMGVVAAGDFPKGKHYSQFTQFEPIGTSHISVVDAAGNAASLTASIEHTFGSRLMAGGFVLNNQLTDFAFQPMANGKPVANAIAPGKRPRSSMAPTIVLHKNNRALMLVAGSPGGARIPNYVTKTLIAVLDWRMPAHDALNLGNISNRNGVSELEAGRYSPAIIKALKANGQDVVEANLTSGTNSIRAFPKHLEGASDGRREGLAGGY